MKTFLMLVMGGILLALAACDSGTTVVTTTAPAAKSGAQELKEDLVKVGHDIKVTAQEAASEAKPVWDKTKAETRDLVHRAAAKVADLTATQPATTQQ